MGPQVGPPVGPPMGPAVGPQQAGTSQINDPEIAAQWAAIQDALSEIRSVPPIGR